MKEGLGEGEDSGGSPNAAALLPSVPSCLEKLLVPPPPGLERLPDADWWQRPSASEKKLSVHMQTLFLSRGKFKPLHVFLRMPEFSINLGCPQVCRNKSV